jgi:hypothetical protein
MFMSTPQESKKSIRDGILDKIENFISSGYGKKEDLRALDKSLRDQYYEELITLRHRWEKVYLEVLEAGEDVIGRECKKVIQTLDRITATVNRADYGYAPLLDRVDKIQEQALTRVLEYDKTLASNLIQLSKDIDAAETSVSEATWPILKSNIDTLRKNLEALSEGLRKRKQAMIGS